MTLSRAGCKRTEAGTIAKKLSTAQFPTQSILFPSAFISLTKKLVGSRCYLHSGKEFSAQLAFRWEGPMPWDATTKFINSNDAPYA